MQRESSQTKQQSLRHEHSRDVQVLRRRLSRFVFSRARGRRALADLLLEFASPEWDALLFGGVLRDLMVFGARAIPRDIDLVIQAGDTDSIGARFAPFVRRRTRFGGYVLSVNGWQVDVWPLADTWALRSGHVGPVSPDALARSTFLNVEAVAVSLRPGGTGRHVYESGFFEAIRSRVVDVSLEDNPYPDLCIVRSLIHASVLGFALSPRLAEYIDARSRSVSVDDLLRTQVQHYGFVRRYREYLEVWLALVRKHVRRHGSEPLTLPAVPYQQLELLGSTNSEIAATADSYAMAEQTAPGRGRR